MLNNNIEIWKECTRIHEVSNYGNVRNTLTKKLLTLQVSTTGYYYVTIRNFNNKPKKHIKVHILVATCFIENISNKPCVNHKDGNKLNNLVENLEWVTHAENMRHAADSGFISKKPRTTGKLLGNSSNYHNVSWDKSRKSWVTGITVNKKIVGRKRFLDIKEAAMYVNYIIDLYQLDRPKNIV